jgi:hypothetical protein
MLQTMPDSLLQYAVDGIIQASSIRHAADLRRMRKFARGQARRERELAQHQADTLHEQALQDGYQQGMTIALQSLLPVIEALQQEQQTLRQAMWDDIQAALQTITEMPAVAIAQLAAACAQWAQDTATGSAAVLYLPQSQPALLQAVRENPILAALEVRTAQRKHPLLEVGPLTYELDPHRPLAAAATQTLDIQLPRLQATLADLAATYAARLQNALSQKAQAERFSQLRSSHETY